MANEQTPSPSPASDPQPDAAASSTASSRASQSEGGGPGFIADAGPQFDPEAAPAPPPPPLEAAAEQLVEWEESVVRSLLGVKGRVLHAAAGAAEADWIYTELDLDAIAPPLTRIANRYEPVRRYAGFGDPVMVFVGMAGYATRSLIEARQAREAAEGDGGTRPIPPATSPPPAPTAPTPDTAPRQASSPAAPAGAPPPPMQPTEARPPAPPPRPAEADVDPTAINWEVPSGQ